jgi:hypothetical protein
VNPVHADNARPRDSHPEKSWVDFRGGYASDRDAHHQRDDRQRELPLPAALLGRLLAVGELGLMPQLCGAGGGEIFHSFGQAGSNVFGVFRPEFHPRCQRGLSVASQLLARLARCWAILRRDRIGRCRIRLEILGRALLRVVLRRVVLRWIALGRVVLGWIALGRVVLRWIALGRVVLRWIVLRRVVLRWIRLGRMPLGGRPLSWWLGHVHRIVRPILGSWIPIYGPSIVAGRLGASNIGLQGAYGIAKRLIWVNSGRLSVGGQRQQLRTHFLSRHRVGG